MTSTAQRIGWQSAVIDSAHASADDNVLVYLTFLSGPVKGQSTGYYLGIRTDEFMRLLQAVNIVPHLAVDLTECLRAMQHHFVSVFVREQRLHEDGQPKLPEVRGVRPLPPTDASSAAAACQEIRSGAHKPKATDEQAGKVLPRAMPFAWRDPATLGQRPWVYGKTALRGAVTITVGHGGSGKSILHVAEAIAMTSGKKLLSVQPERPLCVWYINLEDSKEELERRFFATAMAHGLKAEDFGDRLLLNGSETTLRIASSSRDGIEVDDDVVEFLIEQIALLGVDVVMIDPFVSTHAVNENDNTAIDLVAKLWAQVAAITDAAIMIAHHSRKTGGDEVTAEDSRGAVALHSAARVFRQLNTMSRQQAEEAGLEGRRTRYFYVSDGKANMSALNEAKEWYQFVPHVLPNGPNGHGDEVGVVKPWEWPDTRLDLHPEQLEAVRAKVASERCRRDYQAHAYVGKIVAEALGIDVKDKQSMRGVKALIERWTKDGALVERKGTTDKREEKIFVEVGDWSKAVCRT